MQILSMLTIMLGAISITACTSTQQSQNELSAEQEVRVVHHEGSDVKVSWDPTAKTSATVTHSNKLSIGSHAAKLIIDQATGCTADPWVMNYPPADEGFKSVSMPISCG